MIYYFENEENANRLEEVLESWKGTPYKHWCGVKGMGVDCIHLVVRVYEELGACGKIDIPRYERDWHLHRNEEKLIKGILEKLNVDEIDFKDGVKDGDLILFQYGRTSSHSAIYYKDFVYEAMAGSRVEKRNWNRPDKQSRKRKCFRLKI